jgi:hypothetical protein
MGVCGSQFTSADQSMGRELFENHIRTQLNSIKVYSSLGVLDQKWNELTKVEKDAWYLKGQTALTKLNINPHCSQPDVQFNKDYNTESTLSLESNVSSETQIIETFAFSMFTKHLEPQLQLHHNASYGFIDNVSKDCWSKLKQEHKEMWYGKAKAKIEKLKLEP